jgi:hypothetical protein
VIFLDDSSLGFAPQSLRPQLARIASLQRQLQPLQRFAMQLVRAPSSTGAKEIFESALQ